MSCVTYVAEKNIIANAGGIDILRRYSHYAGMPIRRFLSERQRVIVDASLISDQRDLQREKNDKNSVVVYYYFTMRMQNIRSLAVNAQSICGPIFFSSVCDSIVYVHGNFIISCMIYRCSRLIYHQKFWLGRL